MRPDPMEPCPHGGPVGVRCADCGDPFNYEFAVALRNLWRSTRNCPVHQSARIDGPE